MSLFDVQGINKDSGSCVEEHILGKDNKMKRSEGCSITSVGLT